MSKTTATFTARLKEVMRYYKLKNTDIAKGLGKDNQTIWNYFHNVTKPMWADCCNLIQYLEDYIGQKIDLNTFFYEDYQSLNFIQELQKELSDLKSAHEELTLKYILLKHSQNIKVIIKKETRKC